MASPHECGYPDKTNTGVPTGRQLQRVPEDIKKGPGWVWKSDGYVEVDAPHTTLDSLDVHGGVVFVPAAHDSVLNAHASPATGGDATVKMIYDYDAHVGATDVTVSRVEIVGTGRRRRGRVRVDNAMNATVRRVYVHHTATGIQMDHGLMQDCFIDDLLLITPDSHVNGITSNGNTSGLTIRHNTILNRLQQTDAVSLFQDFGVQENVTIDNNLLAGGGYTIYGGAGDRGPTRNIQITNNRISKLYFRRGGYWGWLAHFESTDPGNVSHGNVWDDSGAPTP